MSEHITSPRRQLLEGFGANLRAIQKDGGWRTDIGLAVSLEPSQLDPSLVEEGLAIYIQRQERAGSGAVERTHRLTTVGLIVKRRARAAAEERLDDVLDDIETALTDRQSAWPRGYSAPVFQSMEPLRAPPGEDWVGALLIYTSNIPIR
ncbi:hypothetical protein [Stenotrophomonas nematodicola]|uniref:hypothetical protein n=1 Tax=Stenotrophomonas nematodicola TaxID=2656746 RepID=UPI0012929811|nr:hypothetical protein [Stenotrophomonas nematodicola]